MDTDGLVDDIQTCVQAAAEQVGEQDAVKLGKILFQREGDQTNLMAMAVMFNAAVFQGHVSQHHATVRSPSQMVGKGDIMPSDVLREWEKILAINYYPIFGVSRDLFGEIGDPKAAMRILHLLYRTAERVSVKAFDAQGLIGKLFGRLIADRKLLATYYTLPSSAVLLAELAVSKLDADWSDPEAILKLRIGDLACGTGALLISAYRRIAERHRVAGGNDEDLHTGMLKDVLLGCDIVPTAVHLTAAMLAGEHPSIDYKTSQAWLMPYGRVEQHGEKAIRTGSLELLTSNFTPTLFGDGTLVVSSTEEESVAQAQVEDDSLDLVIMNPPYTRPVGQEAERRGVPNPAFAGLGNDEQDQKDMSDVLRGFYKQLAKARGPFATDAKAGLSTNFFDLANLKLKPGGVLALILPVTSVSGPAWEKFRDCLHRFYSNITVVSLAGIGSGDRSFSDSTGIAEAMIVATKRDKPVYDESKLKAEFLIFGSRPENSVEAVEYARSSRHVTENLIKTGGQPVGWAWETAFPVRGAGTPEGVANADVAFSAATLASAGEGVVLPQMAEQRIPLARMGTQGTRGPYHMKIDVNYGGCFAVEPMSDRKLCRSVSWPILWSHDKNLERAMIVDPCSEGRLPNPQDRDAALKIWDGNGETSGATFLHINRDFRINSQSLGACMTSVKALGGVAWPSFASSHGERGEKAICLWLNTTLGLIGRWWVSTRQQSGRARLSVSTLGNIPVVDCGKLSKRQFAEIDRVFADFSDKTMLAANECHRDETRKDLDMRFLCGVLKMPVKTLDSLEILRLQWCSEPSVHGGKKTRPSEVVKLASED